MPSPNKIEIEKYLRKVGPFIEGGYVNIHHLKDNGPGKKPSLPGNAHTTIQTAMDDICYWVKKDVDVYVCLSATKDCKQTNGLYPIANRKKDKMIGTKSIWLDIDVKKGAYLTQREAGAFLARFIKSNNLLIPTMIISSGSGGLHVFWTCNRFLLPKEFDKLSTALINIAQQFGLHFDSQCSADRVRVLRPSGTFNFKNGQVRPVTIFYINNDDYNFEQLTNMFNITNNSDEPDDNLAGGMSQVKFDISDIDQVAKACPFIKTTLDIGGKGYSEPLWTYTLMLASYCIDPKETAIRLSNGHEAYSEHETTEKITHIIKDHTNKTIGPPKCTTINREGGKECGTCPHLSLGRSPLNVPGAITPKIQPIKSDDLPNGYYRGTDNLIYTETQIKKGDIYVPKTLKVFNHPIVYKSAWVEPNCNDYHFYFTTYEEGNKEKVITLSYSATTSDDAFKRTMAMSGIPLPRYNKETREMFSAYQDMLRNQAGGLVRDEPIGWTMKDGEFIGFSFDGQYFSPAGQRMAPKVKGSILQAYTPMGSKQPWIELAKIITDQKRSALDVLLLSSFASPLVAMTGHNGIVFGGYSPESGIGKSTSMEESTAVWGHPINARCGLNDTINSVVHKAGQIKNLPLVWDEVKTHQQFTNLVNIVFQLTEGREKGRLNRSAQPQDLRDFQTLMSFAANSSVVEAVQEMTKGTSAGQVRAFEFRVPKYEFKSQHTTVEVQNLQNKLKTNYGMVGLEYAQYLGEHGGDIHKEIIQMQTLLENKLLIGRDERFWASAMTVILIAAKITNSHKWTDIDINELYKFLIIEYQRMRSKKEKAPLDFTQERAILWLLSQFISENRAYNTVIVNRIHTTVGRPTIGSIEVEGRGTTKENSLRQINVVIGREPKMIRFTDSAWGHFCRNQHIPPGTTREGLRNLGGTLTNARITGGTGYVSSVEPCWLLKIEGTPYERDFEI